MKYEDYRSRMEWKAILKIAKTDKGIAGWLRDRERAFKAGLPSDGYTDAIRREYRKIMRGGLVVL